MSRRSEKKDAEALATNNDLLRTLLEQVSEREKGVKSELAYMETSRDHYRDRVETLEALVMVRRPGYQFGKGALPDGGNSSS